MGNNSIYINFLKVFIFVKVFFFDSRLNNTQHLRVLSSIFLLIVYLVIEESELRHFFLNNNDNKNKIDRVVWTSVSRSVRVKNKIIQKYIKVTTKKMD